MSTRGIYTFKQSESKPRHVYVHHDSYPEGAAEKFKAWQDSGLSWPLPRYENCEASAGFIAANKTVPGGIRIAQTRREFCDVEFGYTLETKKGDLLLTVSETDFWDKPREKTIWKGKLSDFIAIGGKV